MSQTLYQHYEEQLQFVRRQGHEFAARHPAAAGRLQLEADRSVDPHVERLIESFAFLTARVQKKLDDDFPELTDALLNVLYPHYLAPIPSLATIQFLPEPANTQPTGLRIERHSRLHTNRVQGVACQFRTCYPVTLWPVELIEAETLVPPFPEALAAPSGTAAAIRLRLQCQGDLRFEKLSLDRLRLHLAADPRVAASIYEELFHHTRAVEFRAVGEPEKEPVWIEPRDALAQVGFGEEEGLLPYSDQSFLGYRLLTELFSFPEKFLYVDLCGFDRVREASLGRTVDVLFHLDRPLGNLEHSIAPSLFRLGCTPVVNLFERVAEPVRLTHRQPKYRIAPDYRRPNAYEVYSIDDVYTADSQSPKHFRKVYDFRHGQPAADEADAFWYASRVESHRPDDHGTDVYLHPVDPNFNPATDGEQTLVVRTTCTNRDLPIQLQHAGERLRFELETAVPLRGIACLRTPTTPLRPPLRRGAQWRLISHLALNHLSLSSSPDAKSALAEMLRLYDFSDPHETQQLAAVNGQWTEGVNRVNSRRVTGRIGGAGEGGICRGVEVAIDLDEEKYAGCEFLFASVLERFLALYASMNSFVQLVATKNGGESLIKRWPPRAGETALL